MPPRRPTRFPISGSRCSARAAPFLTLRDSYRHDLRNVKQITRFQYIRFHAILHDEMASTAKTRRADRSTTSLTSIKSMTAFWQNGVRPFVELSFMPWKLAAREAFMSFWYKPIVSPPKDYGKWDDLIYAVHETPG